MQGKIFLDYSVPVCYIDDKAGESMMNFIEKLEYMMDKKGLSKSKLSQVSGVPYTTIDGFYKKGYENIKLSTARKLSKSLGVTLDYLLMTMLRTRTT